MLGVSEDEFYLSGDAALQSGTRASHHPPPTFRPQDRHHRPDDSELQRQPLSRSRTLAVSASAEDVRCSGGRHPEELEYYREGGSTSAFPARRGHWIMGGGLDLRLGVVAAGGGCGESPHHGPTPRRAHPSPSRHGGVQSDYKPSRSEVCCGAGVPPAGRGVGRATPPLPLSRRARSEHLTTDLAALTLLAEPGRGTLPAHPPGRRDACPTTDPPTPRA